MQTSFALYLPCADKCDFLDEWLALRQQKWEFQINGKSNEVERAYKLKPWNCYGMMILDCEMIFCFNELIFTFL